MKLKKIANNVALQTIGYTIGGLTNVHIYIQECGYRKQDVYKGLYNNFPLNEMKQYAYCKVAEVLVKENVLCIAIEE